MDAASLHAETLYRKAEARHTAKLKQVEGLRASIETAEPRRLTQLQKALSKATGELVLLADRLKAASEVKVAQQGRQGVKAGRIELKLRIFEQRREILDLQIKALKDELKHLKG